MGAPTRRTRIVATLGPASRPPETLDALLRAGVDCVRLNASHSDPDGIRADAAAVRAAEARTGRRAAILLDLQGPKIRTGRAEPPLQLAAGDLLELVMDPALEGSGHRVGVTWTGLAADLEPGDCVLFADGALSARVVAVHPDDAPPRVVVQVGAGGQLGSHKGINVPGRGLAAEALTPKDLADLEAGVGAGVDWVALSFVRRAADVDQLRHHLQRLGRPDLPVCAKIEKPQALEELDGILARVDAIMVARGDLGVEISLERVPVVQKQLIAAANRAGVLVVTATQMLESMIAASRPTRAEAADVANAVLDGTDAVMLSGETAVGRHPVAVVEIMGRLVEEAEKSSFMVPPPLDRLPSLPGFGATVARAACYAVREQPRPFVVFTTSGFTAIVASKARPPVPIVALTPEDATADKLSLAWGVLPLVIPLEEGTSEMLAAAERILLERGLAAEGDEVVVLAGRSHTRGSTNMMTVERLRRR